MRLTKREKQDAAFAVDRLKALGLDDATVSQLSRIQKTLHRWHEGECGTDWGWIERDEATNKPHLVRDVCLGGTWKQIRHQIRDMEAGALGRLDKIRAEYPSLWFYVQTDPRGCALYIGRKDGMALESLDSTYDHGLAIWW